ncbi:ribonuclease Z [Paenibacillus beijingensis]|uniref:Ribonuclease Z n=1 Tax=Paenibacillus beijingensis TaxID=1126833 RepID=A0A0D5NPY7_9BACL|nr:ribonuclease Z [Paenibacillus beijingensis]AJY77067.1 ribonuclease Z [Paenibacillus beijingensis]
MEIRFLGTGAGRPAKERNVSSIALMLPQECGGFWLIDAGEGTQHQLLQTPLKLNKLEAVFITHLHGDHVYGLPGLLSSRSYHEGSGPLRLFGPEGVKELVHDMFRHTSSALDYELIVEELAEGVIYKDECMTVEAAPLKHRVPSWGYRFTEKNKPGPLLTGKLKALGVPPGPLYGRLKAGGTVTLDDGTLVKGEDVVGPAVKGRIITVLGDTIPCDCAVVLAKDADVLVHEATFREGMEEKAHKYGHSTTVQAAVTAREAGAGQLLMTHFSSRYSHADLPSLELEARRVFPNSFAAADFKVFKVESKT